MIYGYGRLAQTLLEDGAVDELNLAIHPVVLGRGETLFRRGDHLSLQLASVSRRRNGVVTLSYRRG
jgi:dihydrofolate reductase